MQCPECFEPVNGTSCSCGWNKPVTSTVIYRNTDHELPPGITKQEFGMNLYNAITLAGAVMQIKDYRAKAVMGTLPKRMTKEDLKAQDKKLIEQMHTAMQALTADELLAFTRRYPWSLK